MESMDFLQLGYFIKHEPLALIISSLSAFLLIIKLLEILVKYLIPFITKKKLPETEWQSLINSRIDTLELGNKKILDRLTANETALNELSDNALIKKFFDEKKTPFERLLIFRMLIAKKKNGRIWDGGFNLIRNNKDVWLDLQEAKFEGEIIDVEYYNERMKEIRTRIFDDFFKR
jgi:hypothetical protein